MTASLIITETDGPVRTITINRPDKRNAVDRPTADALRAAETEAARGREAVGRLERDARGVPVVRMPLGDE